MTQLHIVLVDIDPSLDEAFNAWYENVHIPDILACPGWLSAKRHLCLEGGARHVAIYEITGPEAYETAAFHAIKGFGPFEKDVSNFRRLRLSPIANRAAQEA